MAAIANFAGLAPRVTHARQGRFAGSRVSKVTNGSVVRMASDKQPEFYPEAKVICNGEVVMTVGGTQAEYVVDIWSGNHPFFLGKSSSIMTNAGQVSRFADKFGDLGAMSEVETIDGVKSAAKTEKK